MIRNYFYNNWSKVCELILGLNKIDFLSFVLKRKRNALWEKKYFERVLN